MLRTVAALTLSVVLVAPAPAGAAESSPRVPEQVGWGGAVSSVDPDASQIGIDVLRRGGNAVDAAVATAAALGVTDPFSAGIGGGGFFVHYDARTRRVSTLDGRETAPRSATDQLFVEDGKPLPFAEAMTSGKSVGVPGTPKTWQQALRKWGTLNLREAMAPAEALARRGFVVDQTFNSQITNNAARFADFTSTRDLYLPGGQAPAVGSTFRNPQLADTYRELARTELASLYGGAVGRDLVQAVRKPPVVPGSTRNVRAGDMQLSDLTRYQVERRDPTHTRYRGLDVYGMAAPSSGGTTVGEALNILESTDLSKVSDVEYLHRFIESTKLSFADRLRWVGDPAFSRVPTEGLLSQKFADSRACLIKPDAVLPAPQPAADPRNPQACEATAGISAQREDAERTTHLTTADRWGNVVAYTLTIEAEGGSGIVVPNRGFLLNNELTDFEFVAPTPGVPHPNLPGPGKRPRSSMAPTIVLDHGKALLAVGSPGGSTIITTVTQILTARLDRKMSLVDAVAAPRASQRNAATTPAEAAFIAASTTAGLQAIGHRFSQNAEIGAATAVERAGDGRWRAVAEPTRRGGGAARVVKVG
ncbi:gamma-glutamyltransferase [Lentzea californiensis]|uniref:gamma-glutamyltransferase n=1 Tax=Lentzea californiensis TaxID=438851 RepID=UPI002165B6C1|nr:gamma-glutamyltransferase [Lentzea californiensis]MCR3751068.1 gamma-glutamyltranspeptidase / glutathione hydrolase [Lentzea californiensis]